MDYIREAKRTLSDQWHGGRVSEAGFLTALYQCIQAAAKLDAYKKALFYGKIDIETAAAWASDDHTHDHLPAAMPRKNTDIIHGVIGKATEAGELLEALHAHLSQGADLDEVNILEEIGDGFWYDAILLDAIGENFESAQRVNIEKLRARFPEKFTQENAETRDLEKERAILEDRTLRCEGSPTAADLSEGPTASRTVLILEERSDCVDFAAAIVGIAKRSQIRPAPRMLCALIAGWMQAAHQAYGDDAFLEAARIAEAAAL